MSSKNLLNENTVRRFMKLASIQPLSNSFVNENFPLEEQDEEIPGEDLQGPVDPAEEIPGEELPGEEDELDLGDDFGEEEPGMADMSLTEEEAQILIDLGKRLEEALGEEGGDEEAAEPVELDLEPGEEAEFTKTIDDEINAILVGFESDALKSAQIQGDPLVATDVVIQPETKKWYKSPLAKVLYEQEEAAGPLLDVEKFASEVSRLVINYVNLLDMESHIVNKAKLFLLTKYDEETVEKFEQILDQTYGIALDAGGGEAEVPAPVAVGSGFASAPGGA